MRAFLHVDQIQVQLIVGAGKEKVYAGLQCFGQL